MPIIGFLLTIPIYTLVAVLFAVYVPELFPTALRLRGVGICNAVGRSASIIVPLLIGPLFAKLGIPGVLTAMSSALLAMCLVVVALGTETRIQKFSAAAALTNRASFSEIGYALRVCTVLMDCTRFRWTKWFGNGSPRLGG
jgi:MFS transporter, putative metabolite:H+ symporter